MKNLWSLNYNHKFTQSKDLMLFQNDKRSPLFINRII